MFKFSPGGLTVGSDMGASVEQEGWGERCERGRKKSRGWVRVYDMSGCLGWSPPGDHLLTCRHFNWSVNGAQAQAGTPWRASIVSVRYSNLTDLRLQEFHIQQLPPLVNTGDQPPPER